MRPDDTDMPDADTPDVRWPELPHLDEGTIHAWLDDALSPDETAAVAAHAASCAPCAERVAEARGLIAASSGILAALDDERAGVTVAAAKSLSAAYAEPVVRSEPAAVTPIRSGARRPVWRSAPIWQVAAALTVVAGGAALVMRETPPRTVADFAGAPAGGEITASTAASTAAPQDPAASAAPEREAAPDLPAGDVAPEVASRSRGASADVASSSPAPAERPSPRGFPVLAAPITSAPPPAAPRLAPPPTVAAAQKAAFRSSVTGPPVVVDTLAAPETRASVELRAARPPAAPAVSARGGLASGVEAAPEVTDVWLADGIAPDQSAALAGCWVGASTRTLDSREATLRLRLTVPATARSEAGDASAPAARWQPIPGDSLLVTFPGGTELRLGQDGDTLRGIAGRPGPDGPARQPVVLRRTGC